MRPDELIEVDTHGSLFTSRIDEFLETLVNNGLKHLAINVFIEDSLDIMDVNGVQVTYHEFCTALPEKGGL